MPATAPKRKPRASHETRLADRDAAPQVRFRLRVMLGDVISIGPGKITLLEAVAATNSITAAAKSIGMSYRRAWLLIDEINSSLSRPAVRSDKGGEHGGGSRLTEVGVELVDLYRSIEAQAHASCADDIECLLALLAVAR